jgi:DNA-directed RNA polymerase subunit RPC12/RpoP
MAKQSLGYVELEWTCPFCNTRNPGRVKVCGNCGAPQPKDVQFEQAAEDKIVTDQEGLEMAQSGPDIHCPFCGTRNVSTATKCARCGGDLTGAEKRESGKILGAQQTKPAPDITCDYCGTQNPATNTKCVNCGATLGKKPAPKPAATAAPARMNPTMLIIGGIVLLLICGVIAFFVMRGARTESSRARVTDVGWERSIVVLGLATVQRSAWADQIPQDADINQCSERERGRSTFPTENSEQVCGTPYVEDEGTGFGELVQDCEYIVYDDYCDYSVVALQPIGVIRENGANLNPFWPETRLQQDQQLGDRSERYQIAFDVDGERYVYETTNVNEFLQFQPGSAWELEINGFGNIVDIQPAP